MTQEHWTVNDIEAEHLSGLWKLYTQAERELKLAFTMLCGSKGLREVALLNIDGNTVTVGLPDSASEPLVL
jgi:hypothetical protein